MYTVQPNSFVLSMFIGTMDVYNLIPVSVALALAEVTRSAESRACWLNFLAHSTDKTGIWCDFEAIQLQYADNPFE